MKLNLEKGIPNKVKSEELRDPKKWVYEDGKYYPWVNPVPRRIAAILYMSLFMFIVAPLIMSCKIDLEGFLRTHCWLVMPFMVLAIIWIMGSAMFMVWAFNDPNDHHDYESYG